MSRKISQNDLRKFMNEHKKKVTVGLNGKKVDSPLAKYKDDGTLTCIICESVVRSDSVWTVHINSKQHKNNIARKKQQLLPPQPPPEPVKHVYKRPSTPPPTLPPAKKIKGILKNAPAQQLPKGFFDGEPSVKEKSRAADSNVAETVVEDTPTVSVEMSAAVAETETEPEPMDADEPLPEGFFDDPVLDAKARNVEYKDPIQEEWEKFQKEIKEETTVSTQIIEDDQEEATAERQIQEIDEQLSRWSRVLDLEKKKETVQAVTTKAQNDNLDEDSSEEGEDFDEFLDWRAKKSFK